jgi:hypothetical protein
MTPASWLSANTPIDLKKLEAWFDDRKALNHAHFAPSDEPLTWDTKGKVVTLDAVIMAAHLMTARLVFGGVRSIVDQALRVAGARLKATADNLAEAEIATVLGIGKRTMAFADFMLNLFDADQQEIAVEQKIRKESIDAQRDLWKTALAQRRSRRPTSRVLTRHASPKQRKANKKWHSLTKSSRS